MDKKGCEILIYALLFMGCLILMVIGIGWDELEQTGTVAFSIAMAAMCANSMRLHANATQAEDMLESAQRGERKYREMYNNLIEDLLEKYDVANAPQKNKELEWEEDELEEATNRADTYKKISETWENAEREAMGKLPHRKTYIGSREIMHESADAEADTGTKKDRTVSCTEDNAVKVGDSTLYAYDIDEICNIIGKRIYAYPAFREAVKKIIQDEKPV